MESFSLQVPVPDQSWVFVFVQVSVKEDDPEDVFHVPSQLVKSGTGELLPHPAIKKMIANKPMGFIR